MSGDEESFVILGTSPESENQSHLSSEKSIENGHDLWSRGDVASFDKSLATSKYSIIKNDSVKNSVQDEKFSSYNSMNSHNNSNASMESNKTMKKSGNFVGSETTNKSPASSTLISNFSNLSMRENVCSTPPAREGSLAASFLMGEIQSDVIKATIHSQFPSLCSSSIKSEEFMKLQHVLTEYIELKDTLQKNNIAMRKHFATLQKWQDEVKVQKDEQEKKFNEFQDTVAKLRNENLELRKELNCKLEQFKLCEESMKKENEEMVKIISAKSAQINNMATQIINLEQQQLNSFECINKLKHDNEEEKEMAQKLEHEYVSILEHKRIIKDLEDKLSESIARNLELSDMNGKYLDDIKQLKDRLKTCQDQLNVAQNDIAILKSNDNERKSHFENFERERDEMRNEISILRTQVELYSKDFEMERTSRENLAGEKEKILTELRLLQKKNQELLENSKKQLEMTAAMQESQSSSNSSYDQGTSSQLNQKEEQVYEPSDFVCPLCNRQYKLLRDLQTHVQDCIDN